MEITRLAGRTCSALIPLLSQFDIRRFSCNKWKYLILLCAGLTLPAQTFITSIPIGPQPGLMNPTQMIASPANHKLYVFSDSGVGVIDSLTNRTITHIGGLRARYGMILNPNSNSIFLFDGDIKVLDTATDTIVKTFTAVPPGDSTSASYSGGDYNPVTNTLWMSESYQPLNGGPMQARNVALNGGTGAVMGVLTPTQSSGPTAIGAIPVVNPATNKVYLVVSGGLSTVGLVEAYDGATFQKIGGTVCTSSCTSILNGYLSGVYINPADNSVIMSTWVQTSLIAADGTVLSTPAITRFYRVDGATNQLTSQDAFGFFTGLHFDQASGRLIGSASCIPTTATDPASLSASPCSPLTTTTGMAAFDPVQPKKLILLTPILSPPACSVLPKSSAGAFLGGGLRGMDPATGYFYYDGCTNPPSIFVTKGTFSGTPSATNPPALNTIQPVGTFPAPGVSETFYFTLDPVNHHAFFLNTDNDLSMFDPSIPSLTVQFLGNQPASLAVDAATNQIYVGDKSAKTLNVIDGATNTERPQVYVGQGPLVAVNAATNRVIAAGASPAAADPGQVHGAVQLDGTSENILMPLEAAAAVDMAVNSATNVAYFVNSSQWYAVDLATGSRKFTGFDFAGGNGSCQFTGVAVNSAANLYYIAGSCGGGPGTLAVIDGTRNAVIAQIALSPGRKTGRVAFNPGSLKVYWESDVVTNPAVPAAPAINIYDGATLAFASSITGGRFPIAFNTARNLIYSAGVNANVTTYDGSTNTVVSSAFNPNVGLISDLSLVPAIAVNEATHTIYQTGDASGGFGAVNVFREPLYNLGGRVVTGGGGVPGVTLSIAGAAGTVNVVTDANGSYTAPTTVLPGTYTVSIANPLACGGKFTCAPLSQSVTISTADATNISFLATPNFTISGVVVDALGNPLGGAATVNIQGIPAGALAGVGPATVNASAPADTFNFSFLPAGTYVVTAATAVGGLVYAPQTIVVTAADVTGAVLKPITTVAVTGYTLSPYTMVGAGVATTGTVTINQPAPAGGVTIALSASDTKPARFPATVTVPAGQTSVPFSVQGNSVSGVSTVTLTASYQGPLALTPSSASASLTVTPVDSLKVTSATWSTAAQSLTVTATSTNPAAIITVFNANGNALLGTMTSNGAGSFTFQIVTSSIASVNLKSNLGGSTGQGVKTVP
jgi:hypothetical protein